MKEHSYYVYILASKRNGTFYTGVTNDIVRRVIEHKEKLAEGFTKEHGVHRLVYFEHTSDINAALHREKLIKKWRRSIKMEAIERMNPEWRDLYYDLTGEQPPSSKIRSPQMTKPNGMAGCRHEEGMTIEKTTAAYFAGMGK